MSHPDEGLIHAWLDGELDADEAARIAALVESDRDWAAAAAEARGLIAASSRIIGKLDDVPAGVVPTVATDASGPAHTGGTNVTRLRASQNRGAPWWAMRVAALLVVATGTVLVVRRVSPDEAGKLAEGATDQVPAVSAKKVEALPAVKADTPTIRAATGPALTSAGAVPSKAVGVAAGATSEARSNPSVPPQALGAVAPELKDERRVAGAPAERAREADALRRAAGSGARINAPTAAPTASADNARRDVAEVGKTADQKRVADSAAAIGGASGLRKETSALSLNSVVTTSIGDQRRLPLATECYREIGTTTGNVPVIHRVRRVSDTSAVFLASDSPMTPPVAAQASQTAQAARRQLAGAAATTIRVHADTLFVVTLNGESRPGIRISCPAP